MGAVIDRLTGDAKWMRRAAADRTGVGEDHAAGALTGGPRLWRIQEQFPDALFDS